MTASLEVVSAPAWEPRVVKSGDETVRAPQIIEVGRLALGDEVEWQPYFSDDALPDFLYLPAAVRRLEAIQKESYQGRVIRLPEWGQQPYSGSDQPRWVGGVHLLTTIKRPNGEFEEIEMIVPAEEGVRDVGTSPGGNGSAHWYAGYLSTFRLLDRTQPTAQSATQAEPHALESKPAAA